MQRKEEFLNNHVNLEFFQDTYAVLQWRGYINVFPKYVISGKIGRQILKVFIKESTKMLTIFGALTEAKKADEAKNNNGCLPASSIVQFMAAIFFRSK